MSKQRSGFTLIELLAVIVILAVIALIATPAVLNIIEDSKKAAAEASARNIVSAAKSYYMQNLMDNISIGTIDLSKKTLAYDGEQATKGSISYDKNGNAYGKMYVSGYCVEIKSDGTVSSDKVKESDCNIADISTGGNTSGGNQGGSESGSGSESEGSTTTPALISFTIDGTSYQAEEGMTWEQWVNSDYNTGFSVLDNTIYNGRRNGYVDGVVCSDIIQANSYLIHLAGAD